MAGLFTPYEIENVMIPATKLETGGMTTFTSYFFAPDNEAYKPRWDLVATPSDSWNLRPGEFVPWVPLPWTLAIVHGAQDDFCIVGGWGCLRGDQHVFDVERGHIPIQQLAEEGYAPTVLAWTGTSFAPVQAHAPVLMGKDDYVEVTTDDGRQIVVTPQHRFLTPAGWEYLHDLSVGQQIGVLPRSDSPIHTADARRCPRIASGSQNDCRPSRRLCGEPPLLGSESDQGLLPLPADVRKQSRWPWRKDDRECISGCSRSTPVVGRRATSDFRHLSTSRGLCSLQTASDAASALLARLSQATQAALRWLSHATLRLLAPVSRSYERRGSMASWNDVSYQTERSIQCCDSRTIPQLDQRLDARQCALLCRTDAPDPQTKPCPSCAMETHEYSLAADSFSTSKVSYVNIVEKRRVGYGAYFDLHVPGYENYAAEGFVNHNCGKTLGLAAAGIYWCSMMPNFKFMDVGPVSWQAKQMFDAAKNDLIDWDNREENPRRIVRLIEKIVERPYPLIKFKNGSTMEFLSADENGAKIRSWSGDVAVGDEMGLIENGLNELVGNIGSRLRGQVGGRTRLGKLILMSNADYNPELWDKFDEAAINPAGAAILLSSYDNPYLTEKQLEGMVRRAGSPEKARQMMLSERPLPQGLEFTPSLIEKCQSETLDNIMAHALEQDLPGYDRQEIRKAGVIRWQRPYESGQMNIILGDPGQANPPDRNSACVMVFDVQNFPKSPAELVAFEWIHGNGSYWPFIYKLEEYYDQYHAVYAGFDATGTQKAFDELVLTQRGSSRQFVGMDLAGRKMAMVMALKLMMGKGLVQIPREIKSIWLQLANWHMPDTKLRQDLASCLFMVGQALNDLMITDRGEDESEEVDIPAYGRNEMNRALAGKRNVPLR